jgi:ribosomal protein S18 acetylase RimI-like enzyme
MDRPAEIRRISESDLDGQQPALTALLVDAVESGASVGFLPPLSVDGAHRYWQGVKNALRAGGRALFAAYEGDEIVGSVQLDLATMPNGLHRAEVMKLFVHRRARRQGIGRALMTAVEDFARSQQRYLLVLDTRAGDLAEKLYESMGYVRAGSIPNFARSATGALDATVIMYKWLDRALG